MGAFAPASRQSGAQAVPEPLPKGINQCNKTPLGWRHSKKVSIGLMCWLGCIEKHAAKCNLQRDTHESLRFTVRIAKETRWLQLADYGGAESARAAVVKVHDVVNKLE